MVNGVSQDILVSRLCVYKGVAHLLRDTVLFAGLYNAVDELLVGELDEQPSSVGVGVAVGKTYGAARVVAVGLEIVSRDVGGVGNVPTLPFKVLERLPRLLFRRHQDGLVGLRVSVHIVEILDVLHAERAVAIVGYVEQVIGRLFLEQAPFELAVVGGIHTRNPALLDRRIVPGVVCREYIVVAVGHGVHRVVLCGELVASRLELFYHLVDFSVRSHSFVVHGRRVGYGLSNGRGVAGVLAGVRAHVGFSHKAPGIGYCFAQLHQYAHVLVRYLLDVPVAVACIIILVVGNQTRAVGIVRIEIPAAEYLVEVTCFLYEALCGLARAGYFHQAPGIALGHTFYICVILHTAVFHHVPALGRNRYVPVAHGVELVNHPVPEPIARLAVLRGPVRDKVIAVRLVHETVVALGEGHFLRLDFLNGSVYFPYHCFQVGNTGTYSGLGLAGATFRIARIEDGSHYLDRVTDTKGEINISDLEPGIYSVVEMDAPEGYVKDSREYHVELFPGQNSELVVSNDRMPNLEILKTDAITGKPVAGVTFTVKRVDSSTLTTVTSDENGRCYLEKLMPGVYEIWEQSVPDGYLLNEAHQMITLFPNRTGTVQFQNYPKPTLTVNKIDSITGDPIKGAKFNVTFRSDKTSTGEIRDLGTYYSDENGQFFIDKLDDGWYTITELEPAAGYSIKDPTSQQVYVEAGRGKVVTFENTPLSAIIVKKVDSSTGDPLQGAWFRVRFLGGTSGTGGTVIAERQTSSNGTFILTGLKAGTYVIEEISAPDGYVLSENDIQTVYLSGNEQDVITVTFGNEAKGSVLIKKIDAITREPLSDVEFMVTESNGTVVGNRNGKYVTDSAGTILIDGLDPNTTLVIKEVRAKSGYVLDDTPQTVKVRSHEVVTVEFRNQPLGGLHIVKLDSVTRKPLAGVEFRVAYADGSYVPDEGGKLSSNGIYRTDENGEILISGIVGTLVVTETKTISGYVIDEETRSQTVVIDPDDLQTLTFYNRPAGGLQIIKSDEDTGARIKGVKFEVRKINGEILGTYTTDRNGVISIPNAENGWYTITELKAAEGYELDATPVNVCVKDGETTTVEITNQRMASIMIHKVDAATGEGIYGVKFVLYDAGKNPIGEYATDQDGYIYIDDELTPGKYYIRELEAAEGYIRDEQYKTVYVEAGKCAQIEWENSAVTGQIQIRKYSADDNRVTGQRAGFALEGAVFEITQARSGKVVGYIVTDARGVAASDPLPLGRYFVTEVSAPKYYQLSSEKMEAEIEYPNQIIKLSAYNKSANLGVTIKKTGNREVQPGQVMSYDFSGIGNTSNVALNSFFWHDRIPTDATRAISVTTGTYNARLYYKVSFKTNLSDYRTLASNLLTSNNYSLSLNAATLGLAQGEYVTDVRLEFGTVPSGFASVVKPTMRVQVLGTVSNGYQIINRADVGGQYLNEWQTAKTTWVTTVRRFNTTPLPKTGY